MLQDKNVVEDFELARDVGSRAVRARLQREAGFVFQWGGTTREKKDELIAGGLPSSHAETIPLPLADYLAETEKGKQSMKVGELVKGERFRGGGGCVAENTGVASDEVVETDADLETGEGRDR